MTGLAIARRQVVLLPFPFSDLSAQKLRPALVLASYARPAKLFTAHVGLIRSVAGELSGAAHQRVCEGLIALLNVTGVDA